MEQIPTLVAARENLPWLGLGSRSGPTLAAGHSCWKPIRR